MGAASNAAAKLKFIIRVKGPPLGMHKKVALISTLARAEFKEKTF
jgi:hypothetical protein